MKAWVIQEGSGLTSSKDRYFGGWAPEKSGLWTPDINRAIRFARRVDATRSVGTPESEPEFGDYFRFIEHEFDDETVSA